MGDGEIGRWGDRELGDCGYISRDQALDLDRDYDRIIGQLVRMVDSAAMWVIHPLKSN